MTIDEAIVEQEAEADLCFAEANNHLTISNAKTESTEKHSHIQEYNEWMKLGLKCLQLAEWLKELKQYKEREDDGK